MADYDKVIPPGQTGKITATLSTKNYRGTINKSIVVVSNDPVNPRVKLYLKCSILGVKILPMSRAYFNARLGASQTKEFTIATLGEDPLTVYARSSNPDIKVKLEKVVNETKPSGDSEYWNQYKLFITIPHNFPEGRFAGSITLVTDSKYDPSIKISVSGMVQPDVVVSPGSVRMLTNANGEIPSQVVRVTKKLGDGFKISGVIAEPPALKASFTETKKGRQYSIKLDWLDLKSKGGHRGKVVLHTNDEQKPVITIPVYVNVK